MQAPTKNMLRQLRRQVASLLGLITILAVGAGFYITIKTSSVNYENSSHQYFHEYALPNLLIAGNEFSTEDEHAVAGLAGVEAVQRRAIVDTQRGDHTLRVMTYDTQSPRTNKPYIYDGVAPATVDECLITEKYAHANNVQVGDRIEFSHKQFNEYCNIVGYATTPEDLYLKQSATQPIADPQEFGMLYVDTEFIARHNIPFQELAIVYNDDADSEKLDDQIADVLKDKAQHLTKRPNIYSYNAFKSDVEHFGLMAYVFPLVFLILASIVIFVSQRRSVMRDRRQIGILKAMGYSSWQVIRLYLAGAVIIACIGSALGFGLAQLAGPWVIDNFDSVLSAPFLDFSGSDFYTIVPTIIAVVVCVIATLIAVRRITTIHPAEAMHSDPPAHGRDILLQRTRIWDRLSFNSRYALKAMLRNKGRFGAMVCGVIALLMLTVMSLGFRDSFRFVTSNYYDTVANYDASIQVPPTPLDHDLHFLENENIESYQKALVTSASLTFQDSTEELPLLIAENPIQMHRLTTLEGTSIDVQDGIVIPSYYAEKLGVGIGDTLDIASFNNTVDGTVTVTGLSDQNLGFTGALTFTTAQHDLHLDSDFYNTVYVQANDTIDALVKHIKHQDDVLSVSSLSDDKTSYEKLTDTFGVYTTLLVFFSIVLGLAALYSISTIALLSRNYEFVVLRVMGYSNREILKAYAKELCIQFLIALPIGLAAGYYLTIYLTSLFSNESMLFEARITWISYAVAIVAAICVLLIIGDNARRQINKQDLVSGLKSREE